MGGRKGETKRRSAKTSSLSLLPPSFALLPSVSPIVLLTQKNTFSVSRLLDVIHSDDRLCLVFEYVDLDLKKYMDAAAHASNPVSRSSGWIPPPALGDVKGKGRAKRGLPDEMVYVSLSRILDERGVLIKREGGESIEVHESVVFGIESFTFE